MLFVFFLFFYYIHISRVLFIFPNVFDNLHLGVLTLLRCGTLFLGLPLSFLLSLPLFYLVYPLYYLVYTLFYSVYSASTQFTHNSIYLPLFCSVYPSSTQSTPSVYLSCSLTWAGDSGRLLIISSTLCSPLSSCNRSSEERHE